MPILRKLAYALGWRTTYHVSAVYRSQKSPGGWSIVSTTIRVRPWVNSDNWTDVVEYMASVAESPISHPNIISLDKIGH